MSWPGTKPVSGKSFSANASSFGEAGSCRGGNGDNVGADGAGVAAVGVSVGMDAMVRDGVTATSGAGDLAGSACGAHAVNRQMSIITATAAFFTTIPLSSPMLKGLGELLQINERFCNINMHIFRCRRKTKRFADVAEREVVVVPPTAQTKLSTIASTVVIILSRTLCPP